LSEQAKSAARAPWGIFGKLDEIRRGRIRTNTENLLAERIEHLLRAIELIRRAGRNDKELPGPSLHQDSRTPAQQ
jgi:hypothetical protein